MPFYTRPNFEDRQVVQYSGTSISLSGITNIDQSGYLKINKGAFPGLVATSLDSDGTVVWGPISGVSWSVSACTSPLYVNNLVSCPLSAGTIQVDAGNLALNSELNFLISLSAGTNTDEVLVIDNNGYIKTIPNLMGIGNMWHIPVGYTLTVPDNYQSFIYGDILIEGTIDLQTNAQLVILNGNIILSGGSIIGSGTTYLVTLGGGSGCCFTGGTGSCITDLYVTNIHGCSPINIQPTSPDDVYMVMGGGNVGIGVTSATTKLHVSGNTILGSQAVFISDVTTTQAQINTFLNNGNRGLRAQYNHTGDTVIGAVNINTSGRTGFVLGRGASTTNFGITNNGSDYIRTAIVPVDGFDFYKNKIVFQSGDGLDGIVFNLKPMGNNGRLWFEQNANAPMIIAGGGTPSDLRLGIALNPDGTEMPTSSLQLGGTGTTGTFKYVDGNQQSGYVLTSDLDGNATWQASTGGGSGTTIVQFTGNTSGTCINDLYVHNLYGCSPIMLHDTLSGNSTNNYLDISSINDNLTLYTRYSALDNFLSMGSTYNGVRLQNSTLTYLDMGGGGATLRGTNQLYLTTNNGKTVNLTSSNGISVTTEDAPGTGGSIFQVKANSSAGVVTTGTLTGGTLQSEIVFGKPNISSINLPIGVMGTGLGTGTNFYGVAGFDYYPVFISTPRSYAYDDSSYSSIKNVLFGGGSDNKVYTGVTNSALIGGSGNTINQSLKNTVIIGGEGITGTSSNTVYVPNLNISNIGVGTSVINLGLDANGFVVTGTAGGGGAGINPYYDLGPQSLSITWDVSGNSINYEVTLTGNTDLDLINVRNGDYGTLIVNQDSVGGRSVMFNTVNGSSTTHLLVNGGGGSPNLTSTPNAIDILSFTYNGSKMFWTVGNDYT